MDMRKRWSSLPVQARSAFMGCRTGLLTEIAADANIFIDEQHIGGFT